MNYIKLIILLLCIPGIIEAQTKNTIEQTFAMIKPHAVQEGKTEEIIDMIKEAGFTIVNMKKLILTPSLASQLYQEYKHRSWFNRYIKKMSNKPAIALILEKDNAVTEWAEYKQIVRATYWTNRLDNNIVHGSDSIKAARREIELFFKDL